MTKILTMLAALFTLFLASCGSQEKVAQAPTPVPCMEVLATPAPTPLPPLPTLEEIMQEREEAAREVRAAFHRAHGTKPVPLGDAQRVRDWAFSGAARGTLAIKPYGDGSWQIVFTEGGSRYTIYATSEGKWLSYWVRPEGTVGKEVVVTFTDDDFDGFVDFGIQHVTQPGGPRHFNVEPTLVGETQVAYWQRQYADAIAATIRHFGLKTE